MPFQLCWPIQPACYHKTLEHQKKDSPEGDYLAEVFGTEHSIEWEIIDAIRAGVEKLMTIEAINIKMLKLRLNTRDE